MFSAPTCHYNTVFHNFLSFLFYSQRLGIKIKEMCFYQGGNIKSSHNFQRKLNLPSILLYVLWATLKVSISLFQENNSYSPRYFPRPCSKTLNGRLLAFKKKNPNIHVNTDTGLQGSCERYSTRFLSWQPLLCPQITMVT